MDVAFRSSRTRTTVPSRINRTIGSSASERPFQASQSPFTLRQTRLTVSFPTPPNFGSPTKLFEYMAMGKAILASDLDQIGDVLSGGVPVDALASGDAIADEMSPALLARPGDPAQIVQGLKFLVENPDRRHALGTNARRLALERYTWRHHVRAILDRTRELGLILAQASSDKDAVSLGFPGPQ
jgi:hypothetical protein